MVTDDYAKFIELIRNKTGIDLSQYKEKQMKRRLTTLRMKRGFKTFTDYYHAILKDENLYHEFLDRMTINVSEFYRNKKRWDVLEEQIIPGLLKNSRQLKVWSAACSTGEEPYTLAMILSKFMPVSEISILATDIDEHVLNMARKGTYTEKSLKEIPREMLDNYFIKDGNFYHVDSKLKKCVTFKKHNLLADPYSQSFDLIVCRNVLIYFTEEAKAKVYQKFSDSLNPGGILFVGSTEQIFNPGRYGFETAATFFYRKK